MKNECNIIRDILPLYAENIVCEDTAAFVEEHLEHCESCRRELEELKAPSAAEEPSTAYEAAQLRMLKKKLTAKKVTVGVLSSISTAALILGIKFPELTIDGADYSVVFLGLLGAALFFGLQCLFCFKAKKTAVKLIPVYITLLGLLLCVLMYLGVFGNWSGGFIGNVNRIFAVVFGVIIIIAAIGETAAWVLYWLKKRK